jgi:hypothetical protein
MSAARRGDKRDQVAAIAKSLFPKKLLTRCDGALTIYLNDTRSAHSDAPGTANANAKSTSCVAPAQDAPRPVRRPSRPQQ